MLVLVPNFRSSRQLQDALAAWRRAQGAGAVQPAPAILAVDLWLTDLWQDLALRDEDERLSCSLLSALQEELLWERAISDSPAGAGLLNVSGAARAARQAWQELLQWQLPRDFMHPIPGRAAAPREFSNSEAFGDWALRFQKLCLRYGTASFSAMLCTLLDLCAQKRALLRECLPAGLALWGFGDPPPLYRALFNAMQDLGIEVSALQCAATRPQPRHLVYGQPGDEILGAAEWAAATLAREPDATIGIICPDLQQQAATLQRIVTRTPGLAGRTLCTVTQGVSNTAFLHVAERVLQLHEENGDTLQLCELLRSPWLAGATQEREGRARMEMQLRERGELHCKLSGFLEDCQPRGELPAAPLFAAPLLRYRAAVRQPPARRTLPQWLQVFTDCWSGILDTPALERSGDRAQLRAWLELPETLLGCSHLLGTCTLHAALQLLHTVLQQPQPPLLQTAPVMLLSPLASAGLRFTHVWCMGMTERQWPPESSPSPYLPLPLQIAAAMPGSDPGRSLEQARALLQGLAAATSAGIVYSHAAAADDLQQKASRLLPAIPAEAAATPSLPAGLHPALRLYGHACGTRDESTQLPLPVGAITRGGSALLADQAACPFRAFAKVRLAAGEFPAPAFGLNAAATGSCIHRMFEHFWSELPDSAALWALDEVALALRISDSVARALRETARDYPATMTQRFRALEQQRLEALLQQWLQQERLRGSFRRIDAEQRCSWRHGALTLLLRIDRMDADAHGNTVLVDYKTGRLPRVDWEAVRQDQPQLPLYLQAVEAAGQAPVSALLYAAVNVEKSGYSGIGLSDDIHPGIAFDAAHKLESPDWDSLKRRWREQLENLADEYLAGIAAVAPLRRNTCSFCHLQALCRIQDLRTLPGDGDDDAGDDA